MTCLTFEFDQCKFSLISIAKGQRGSEVNDERNDRLCPLADAHETLIFADGAFYRCHFLHLNFEY